MSVVTKPASESNRRLGHGVIFILVMACCLAVPVIRRWPWMWAAPMAVYLLITACVPALRRSLSWFQLGRPSVKTVVITMLVSAVTVLGLMAFQATKRPDLSFYRAALPLQVLGGVLAAGAVFSIVNATLEEFVFRGVLFDALQSQWSMRVTLIGTALLFGLGHLHGYPPGPLGVCLATLFGFVLGVLRLWTGGLAMPILAHIAADATIYGILIEFNRG